MTVADTIRKKLTEGLSPVSLELVDESDRHAGHAGNPGGGETHFRLTVVSAAFEGKPRIERHRMVTRLLAAELEGPVHALAITARTPDEQASQ